MGSRKILVHDFAGHPFQAQLSRRLSQNYQVTHAYCRSVRTGRGNLGLEHGDPDTLRFLPLMVGREFPRHSLARRPIYELAYGRLLTSQVIRLRPEVVISANAPLMAQWALQRSAIRSGAAFVYWVQDLLGIGTSRRLSARFGQAGVGVGRRLEALERKLLRISDHVVVISEDFVSVVQHAGVAPDRISVIENWAPLDEIPSLPRDNPWAREKGLADQFVFLYSGTLGLKHDPSALVALAVEIPWSKVVVISKGPGADWLRERKGSQGLSNLEILDYQPYKRLPEVLASADVLVALLEPDAGVFSVPSKVLTYQCAGRPLLCAIPSENLASRIVERNDTGVVVDPGDIGGFVGAGKKLAEEPTLRQRFGHNARRYAERAFDIEAIADRFEEVLERAIKDRAH